MSAGSVSGSRAVWALSSRELQRYARQPSRIIASIGTPALMWLVLGAGFAGSFSHAGAGSYGQYLIPGMATMSVVFAAIFAAMSLIEDRNEGFLQGVLISPAPSWAVVLGKALPAALLAALQALVIVLASPLSGQELTFAGVGAGFVALGLMGLGVCGVSLAMAWRVNSTAGFHGVMNLLLMPMLLLSGAFFPIATASRPMSVLMSLNPLSWPTRCLREALAGADASAWPWALACAFAAGGLGFAWVVMARGR